MNDKKPLTIELSEFDRVEIGVLAVRLGRTRKKLIETIINGVTHDPEWQKQVKKLVDLEDGII